MKQLAIIVLLSAIFITARAQDDVKTLAQNGNLAFSAKEYEKALGFYEQAIKVGIPDSIDLSWVMGYAGICSEELGKPEKAKDYYTKALNLGFPNTSIYNRMYVFCKKNNDIEGQEFALEKMKHKFTEEADNANNRLISIYGSVKDYAKLNVLYDELIAKDSTDYKLYAAKGNVLAQLNKTEDAKQYYLKALSLNPDDQSSNMYLGLIYYNQGCAVYDYETAKYKRLKTPTQDDYIAYQRNVRKGKDFYNLAEPYLVKSYNMAPDATVKKALYTIYDRLGQLAKAQKYK